MRAQDHVAADVGERDEVNVAPRRATRRRQTANAYHSSLAKRSAATDWYDPANSRFSSFWAAMAACRRSCSASATARRIAAATVALTLDPVSAALARRRSPRSDGRLIESLVT